MTDTCAFCDRKAYRYVNIEAGSLDIHGEPKRENAHTGEFKVCRPFYNKVVVGYDML